MDRRRFLLASLAGALAAPFAGEAQQAGKLYRIGYLDPSPLSFGEATLLETALRERGWVKQRDYVLEARWADRKHERFTELAAEPVRLKANLIVARGTEAATAASRATRDIPIVFDDVADPVGAGLVATHAHPGANVTGTERRTAALRR